MVSKKVKFYMCLLACNFLDATVLSYMNDTFSNTIFANNNEDNKIKSKNYAAYLIWLKYISFSVIT